MSDILGRIGNILRANVNDAIDQAEDPQKMLDQYIRDYTNDIDEAEQAVAQAIGNLRLSEDDLKRAQTEVADWGTKAAAAATRATQSPADAARFDELAKAALKNQIAAEGRVKTLTDSVAQQTDFCDKLKIALNGLRAKREQLVQKRDELVARQKMAEAQRQVQESFASIDVKDPTSDIARMEEKVRREEALSRGMAEVGASSLDAQFDELAATSDDLEVDARLAALKSGTSPASPPAPAAAPAPVALAAPDAPASGGTLS